MGRKETLSCGSEERQWGDTITLRNINKKGLTIVPGLEDLAAGLSVKGRESLAPIELQIADSNSLSASLLKINLLIE